MKGLNEMKIAKIAMAALVTTGLSMGMVACSSEGEDVQAQEQGETTESSTATTATATPVGDATQNDEGEDLADEPAPPTEVTGFVSDEIEHVANYHQIPIDYLNDILDGTIPSESQYIGDGMGPTFMYHSFDVTLAIGDDGVVKELSPARAALDQHENFRPRYEIYDPEALQKEFQFTR